MALQKSDTQRATADSSKARQCGDCAACCEGWLKIEIRGHPVYPGKKCPFCTRSGCSIYDERPEDPCRKFICGWLAHRSPLPDWMRPDKSNAILLVASFAWHGIPVDVAVPAGNRIKEKALTWLQDFYSKQKRLLVFNLDEEWYAFGPPAFQQDIRSRLQRGEFLWDN